MKNFLEYFFSTIIAIGIVTVGFAYFVTNYAFGNLTETPSTKDEQVLGINSDEKHENTELSEDIVIVTEKNTVEKESETRNKSEVFITSAIKADNLIFFDNTNHESLEGSTEPNSLISFVLNNN